MPQVVPAIATALGGGLLATIAATAIVTVATTFLSGILLNRPNVKSDRTERSLKTTTPVRNRGFGARRLCGSFREFDPA